MKEYWKKLIHPEIVEGYYISTNGRIKTDYTPPNYPVYHSSNGYDYIQFVIKKESSIFSINLRYYPVDELVALIFLQCPPELIGVPVKVEHINGDPSDSTYENLKWVEDIEEWKDIPGYDGDYQVSNKGLVKSLKHKNEHILLPYYDKDGYAHVVLCKDAITKHFNVHRLVLMTFSPIDNSNEMVVNHIDENVTHNNIKNLECVLLKKIPILELVKLKLVEKIIIYMANTYLKKQRIRLDKNFLVVKSRIIKGVIQRNRSCVLRPVRRILHALMQLERLDYHQQHQSSHVVKGK